MHTRFTGLWRHADFRRLWFGETVSIFGTLIGMLAMQFTAVLWLNASAFGVAVLAAAGMTPGFVVGLFAGVWVDRLQRRPIMIAADIGRAALLATIPIAAVFGVLTLAQLCVVAFLAATLTVFFDVAYEAYLPTLVTQDELIEGNAKLTASASVAEFGSFGVAGWLVQLLKGPGAIVVDAASFLVSAFSLWRIRAPEPPATPEHEREHVLREAIEGVRVVTSTPMLRSIALANLLAMGAARMLGVVYLLYLVREVGFNAGTLGMIFAVGGLTSLAGAAIAGRPGLFGALGPAIVVAAFLRAAGTLFMPLAASVSVLGVALLVANQLVTDPAWTFYEVHTVSLRQAITPNRLLGRMNATIRFGEFGASLAGTVIGGLLGGWIGFRETLLVAVGIQFAAAVTLLFGPMLAYRAQPAPMTEVVGREVLSTEF